MTSLGNGLDSLELPGVHSFPQFSDTEAFVLSKGSAVLPHPRNFPQHTSSSAQPHWWDGLEWSEWKWTFLQPLYLTISSSCCCILLFQPHLWSSALRSGAMVSPRCLQGMMVPHSLEKSMVCFPLFPDPSISLVSLQNLQQIVVLSSPCKSRTQTGKGGEKKSSKGKDPHRRRGSSTPLLRGKKCPNNLFNSVYHLLPSLCTCRH